MFKGLASRARRKIELFNRAKNKVESAARRNIKWLDRRKEKDIRQGPFLVKKTIKFFPSGTETEVIDLRGKGRRKAFHKAESKISSERSIYGKRFNPIITDNKTKTVKGGRIQVYSELETDRRKKKTMHGRKKE